MSKHTLLKICRIQEIDLFFTERGFSRSYIHKKIIYPNFFLSKRAYYNYLSVNAKAKLRELGIDWEEELRKITPVDYMKIMNENQTTDFLQTARSPEYKKMIEEGCKH